MAVFNTSADTTDLLRVVLEQAGFVVVTAHTNDLRDGRLDFGHFLAEHHPRVIVYDVAIPYVQNWRLLQHFRSVPSARGIPFVVTTTNAQQVRRLVDRTTQVYEIVGKPLDLAEIVGAVREAAHERLRR